MQLGRRSFCPTPFSRVNGPARKLRRGTTVRRVMDTRQHPSDDNSLFRFGVVSDIQYADIPDGRSFHGVPRYYRNALPALRRAVQGWLDADTSFGLHLGDILDGFQAVQGQDKSEAALTAVLECFQPLQRPVRHLLGNHCLYNLSRARLNERLAIPAAADGASYYSFCPHPAWRLVALDTYDVSLLGWPAGHPRHQQAEKVLNESNPNQEKNSPEGLVGLERRFVKFGGGLSDTQLDWLQQELQDAADAGQCVVIASHLPLFPGTCPPACLVWNYQDVLQLLQQHPGVVVASIAGHTHQNGYLVDEGGVHHLVLPAIVETPPGRDCYGWVNVSRGCLTLHGVDTCMSCQVKLSPAVMQHQQRHFTQQQEEEDEVLERAAAAAAGHGKGGSSSSSSCGSDIIVDVADAESSAAAGKGAAAAAAAAAQLATVTLVAE